MTGAGPTPGPWRVERGTRSWTRPWVRASGALNNTPQGPAICRVLDAVGSAQTAANAYLIAAAPALLAFAERIKAKEDSTLQDDRLTDEDFAAARSALMLARGEGGGA